MRAHTHTYTHTPREYEKGSHTMRLSRENGEGS